ncbi:MAG: protein translocase subunit SecF [Actinomycetota bacterium]|nr:protein translocase subunit SecF [Actinomycetota bacterium]
MRFREAISTFRGHRAPHLTIIPRRNWWFALSGFFILLSLIGLFARGLNFSIDFKGGALLKYPDTSGVSADQVRSILARYGRSDAEVQVVAGQGVKEVSVRTRSLNDLGGPPQTQLTYPNTTGVTTDDVKATLAEFGITGAKISETGSTITVTARPISDVGKGTGIVFFYKPVTANLTASQVQSTLTNLGHPEAIVTIAGGMVVVQTQPFTAPTPTPSASASAGATPTASPSAKASATPSASPSAAASPSASAAPTASPTPAPATKKDAIAALAKQAGIDPSAVSVHDLSKVDKDQLIAALATQAGTTPTDVRAKALGGDERARLLSQLATQAGVGTADINIQDVGPTWGAQISSKAIQGLVIFLILVTVYIAFRFEWKMALAAQTALLHDLIITAGIYALVGREVTPATVIAILTILGYSLYDTVVIFDRVKENTESITLVARDGYSNVVNLSLNETLMRSVNTSLVVLLPILSLLLFGGSTLKDFAFALFVGVASGTYSSIFIASPVLALLKEREPRYQQIRARALARGTRPTLRSVPRQARLRAGDGEGERTAAVTATGTATAPGTTTVSTPPRRPQGSGAPRPAGSKPKKKKKTTAAKRRRR